MRLNSKRIDADHNLQLGDMVRIPPVRMAGNSVRQEKSYPKSGLSASKFYLRMKRFWSSTSLPGVAVHGGSGVSFGVIEQLRAQHPDWKFLELVHRLDRETSGSFSREESRCAR